MRFWGSGIFYRWLTYKVIETNWAAIDGDSWWSFVVGSALFVSFHCVLAKLKILHNAPILLTHDDFHVHQFNVDYGYIFTNCNISASKQDMNNPKTPRGSEIPLFLSGNLCMFRSIILRLVYDDPIQIGLKLSYLIHYQRLSLLLLY